MASGFGQRMRERRTQLGLTLSELAEKLGVTSSYLSYVERDAVSPSLSSLTQIAKELGVPLAYFFAEAQFTSQVARDGQRSTLQLAGADVKYELLTRFPGCRFGCMIVHLETGVSTLGSLQQHPQEECLLVFEGVLELQIGPERHILEEGDSAHYDGLIPHRIMSVGDKQAVFLLVVSPHAT
jgi:transcriptional regulator with XRE-family HTH domain